MTPDGRKKSTRYEQLLASQSIPTWNRIVGWLHEMEMLRVSPA
jgi:hypothetical protein